MRRIAIVTFACIAAFSLAAPVYALQCVPYARDNSGITLKGNAWTWWSSAQGRYERGAAPRAGAVMVFKKSGKMRYGHVAVVSEVEHSRKLTIHHANWGGGRGKIATDIAVIDVSPRNDWSQVRVWNRGAGIFGRVYPIYGFIYPARQGGVVQAINKRPAPAEPVLVPPVEFSAVSPIRFDVPPPIEPVPRVESVMASSIEPVVEPAALPVERVVVAIAAERPARTPPAEKRPAAKQNEVVATNDMDAVLARKFGSGQYGAAK